MSYMHISEVFDTQVLDIAKAHIKNGTFPISYIGSGKSTLTMNVLLAMMCLKEQGYTGEEVNVLRNL